MKPVAAPAAESPRGRRVEPESMRAKPHPRAAYGATPTNVGSSTR